MPGFRGFGISAFTFLAYTFGLSMAGMSRRTIGRAEVYPSLKRSLELLVILRLCVPPR